MYVQATQVTRPLNPGARTTAPWPMLDEPRAPLRGPDAPVDPTAGSFKPPVFDASWSQVGRLQDARIAELSGVVVGRANPDVLWVHNDSGDSARIFAISRAGATLAEVAFDGVKARDWEDIAMGPGPRGSGSAPWIYVADTGDNDKVRHSIELYRTPEPGLATTHVAPQRIELHYPDGDARNAETLLVDPLSGDVVIVGKSKGKAELFSMSRDDIDAGGGKLHAAGSLDLSPEATGGDVSADGRQVVVRTKTDVYRWTRQPGERLVDAMAREPIRIPTAWSEAIAITADGSSWITIPEGVGAQIMQRSVPASD